MTRPAVDVVLPALDEALALPTVLAGLPLGYRAIVVDNGSTDATADIARRLGALVVHEPRRGFGSACAAGLAAATADVVAFCDADASLDLGDLPLLVGPIARGEADLVLGARQPTDRGAWPVHARIANRFLARRLRRRFAMPVTDLGPMRAATRAGWTALAVEDRGSGWPLEQLVRAGHLGWVVQEVAVPYRSRTGRSKVTGTVRGTVGAVRAMRRVLRTL